MKNKSSLKGIFSPGGGLRIFFAATAYGSTKGKWSLCVLRLLLFQLLVPSLAIAAPATETPDSVFPMAGLRLVIALGLVLGIFLLFYALSRKGFKLMPGGGKSGIIKVVEMRSLGPKKALCLVEVRGEELLLGVGADRVELISKMGPAIKKTSFEDEVQAHLEELK
ncbi:MAG: FliO/MopB family protein [Deltaproteobacteria bacterium]|nr:FliO/MopB family protein [Deltaproteobacteria bacterium]